MTLYMSNDGSGIGLYFIPSLQSTCYRKSAFYADCVETVAL